MDKGFKADKNPGSPDREMVLGNEVIRRGDIPEILNDEEVIAWMRARSRFKIFGNPLSEGWMEWPAHWVDAFEAMEAESQAIQEEKRQQEKMRHANN